MSLEATATPLSANTTIPASIGGLRTIVVATGLGWALAFIVVGVCYRLQLYGDGAIFSYAVAAGEGWAVHWHNIANRISVYFLCLAPAEVYVRWTRDAAGGLAIYGLLFLGAPLIGLAACFAADRSASRAIFSSACASTACLCPLVFGFPTEMWMAHAVFWPTLALCHFTRGGFSGFAALFVGMLVLILTHEGAVVLAVAIVIATLLRGADTPAFRCSASALVAALAVWGAIRLAIAPDAYFAPVLARAELDFFNPRIFLQPPFALLAAALVGYGVAAVALRRFGTPYAHVTSALIVIAGLSVCWLQFHPALHAENRYFLRTALVIATPCFAILATALAFPDQAMPKIGWIQRLAQILTTPRMISTGAIALLLATLVNAVEVTRFVTTWTDYTAAVRGLAVGTASDPALGSPLFVSSRRIAAALQPVSWSSTTPFLSVLLAPEFKPARLLVDPDANYFWLPCPLARDNEAAALAVPVESRRLIRAHACLHR